MLIFRLVFGLLLVVAIGCLATWVATGDVRWRQRGVVVAKWTIVAALGFFAVLILERLALML